MPGGRPPLALNTYGEIHTAPEERKRRPGKPSYRAKALYRDSDGVTRPVVRYGETEGRAKAALRAALAERQQRAATEGITPNTPVKQLADMWLAADHGWRPGTAEGYRLITENQIKPRLGGVRLSEIKASNVNRVLQDIKTSRGNSSALTAKRALSGMFKMAVLNDAMPANPALGTVTLPQKRSTVRALTPEEQEKLTDGLRTLPLATRRDLPDLIEFMLGTGARLGEACAARTEVLDLEAGTWEINATVIRVRGQGLQLQPRTKTDAGWRVVALPSYVVQMVQRRATELRLDAPFGIVFGNPRDKNMRDTSNTANDLREVLDGLGCDVCQQTGLVTVNGKKERCDAGPWSWVTSHVFRKTVATRLDEAGLTARQIADQLGHAKPSMTLDVYMGRRVVSADAARILDH